MFGDDSYEIEKLKKRIKTLEDAKEHLEGMNTDLNDRMADYLLMIERYENTIDDLLDALDTKGSGS